MAPEEIEAFMRDLKPGIPNEEDLAAMEMYMRTGCVPADWHYKHTHNSLIMGPGYMKYTSWDGTVLEVGTLPAGTTVGSA